MSNFFHESVQVSDFARIEISNRGTHTYIGANCVIDDFVKIKHVGGDKDIRIGSSVFLNSGTVLYSGNGITIGDNVLIGPNCNIVPVNHEIKNRKVPICLQGMAPSKGGIIIEDDVWLGANVTVLDGAIIRKGAVIGANS
ncbi:MAG: acyltransferase, partial [Crocinitomicaceae bacterium]|nr:acyltransferase [Crocinitomicaceae bacterium]